MYERSAIVLERYIEEKLGLNKRANLKVNYENFRAIIDEMQRYQTLAEEEEQIIREFDVVAKELQNIQKTQDRLYKSNLKLEDDRNQLFNNLDEDPISLEKKLGKIEINIDRNNEELKSLKTDFIKYLTEFIGKQKERNKYAKSRRLAEANNMGSLDKATKEWEEIDIELVRNIKESFLTDEELENEISKIMINNGKEEKVGFNIGVINSAIKARLNIAKEEAQCYVLMYDRMKRLLLEIENDTLKISKYQKIMRDTYVKLTFLEAKKDYIVRFLDNERMTSINGEKVHKKMMQEACENFEADIIQIDNLYELIMRETVGKATKKSYKELYNKTYLKEIEDKEKNFEQEVNRIRIYTGTIINSNYWRIEGIKNIYEIFLKEVGEKFERDLSEYTIEEPECLPLVDIDEEEVVEKIEPKSVKAKSKRGLKKKSIINNEEENEIEKSKRIFIEDDEDEESDEFDRDEYDEYDEDYEYDEYDEDEVDFDEYDEDDDFDFGEEDDDDEYDEYDDDEYDDDFEEDDDDDFEEDDEFNFSFGDEDDDEEDFYFDDKDEKEEEELSNIEIDNDLDSEELEEPKSVRDMKKSKKEGKKIFDKIFKEKKKKAKK